MPASPAAPPAAPDVDAWLFGWDPTPGIVSVWADRAAGPWSGSGATGRSAAPRSASAPGCSPRPWTIRRTWGWPGPAPSPARPSRRSRCGAWTGRRMAAIATCCPPATAAPLERAILAGAARRLGRPVARLADLGAGYYAGRPGRAVPDGDRARLLSRPGLCRSPPAAIRPGDDRAQPAATGASSWSPCAIRMGWPPCSKRPPPPTKRRLIADLCALIRERDPDVIENHNLFGFDLPFLHERARAAGRAAARWAGREGPPLLERYAEPGAVSPAAAHPLQPGGARADRHAGRGLAARFRRARYARLRPQGRRALLRRGRARSAPTCRAPPIYATYQRDPRRCAAMRWTT